MKYFYNLCKLVSHPKSLTHNDRRVIGPCTIVSRHDNVARTRNSIEPAGVVNRSAWRRFDGCNIDKRPKRSIRGTASRTSDSDDAEVPVQESGEVLDACAPGGLGEGRCLKPQSSQCGMCGVVPEKQGHSKLNYGRQTVLGRERKSGQQAGEQCEAHKH